MCTPNVSKNDDDNGNGKRLGAFCFNCVLRNSEHITAGIILGNLQYAATLV
jgi:hypothetical protein